jgi:hypothetical protein
MSAEKNIPWSIVQWIINILLGLLLGVSGYVLTTAFADIKTVDAKAVAAAAKADVIIERLDAVRGDVLDIKTAQVIHAAANDKAHREIEGTLNRHIGNAPPAASTNP